MCFFFIDKVQAGAFGLVRFFTESSLARGAQILTVKHKECRDFFLSFLRNNRWRWTGIIDPGYNCDCAFWRVMENQQQGEEA